MKSLLIEIWSDVVCPYCYVGKRALERAIGQLSAELSNVELDILWKSFELDPDAKSAGIKTIDMLQSKYRVSLPRALEMQKGATELAHAVGLNYRLEDTQVVNSFDAHRLLHAASSFGKQGELAEAFFHSYFCEARSLGEPQVLLEIAQKVGIEIQGVKEVLQSDLFGQEVRQDEQEAQELGISGVPFFVFNRKYAVSGAQPVEVFEQIIRKVLAPAPMQ